MAGIGPVIGEGREQHILCLSWDGMQTAAAPALSVLAGSHMVKVPYTFPWPAQSTASGQTRLTVHFSVWTSPQGASANLSWAGSPSTQLGSAPGQKWCMWCLTAESEGEVLGESVSVWGKAPANEKTCSEATKSETELDVYFPTLACEPLGLMFTLRLVLSWPLSCWQLLFFTRHPGIFIAPQSTSDLGLALFLLRTRSWDLCYYSSCIMGPRTSC